MSAERFKGVVICCTGIGGKERDDCYQAITKGGGSYRRDLNEEVTHLIASSNALSEKYKMAVAKKIPILHPRWLTDSTLARSSKFVPSNVQNLDEFSIKPFSSFVICISGYSIDEREWVAQTIKANGGTFSPDLSRNCTHLVADLTEIQNSERVSPKIAYAQKWNVPIVSIKWIAECAKRKGRLDENKFSNEDVSQTVDIFHGRKFFIFSGVDNSTNDLQQLIEKHHGVVVNEVHESDYIICITAQSHLETSGLSKLGIPIIHSDWIDECIMKGTMTPNEPHIITLASPSDKVSTPHRRILVKPENLTCNSLENNSLLHQDLKISITSLGKKLLHECTFFIIEESFQSELLLAEVDRLIVSNDGIITKCIQDATHILSTFNWPAARDLNLNGQKPLLVTDVWLFSCVQENSILLLDSHLLFVPSRNEIVAPVKNSSYIICITGFEGLHRELTVKLIEICGYKYSDKFSKKVSFLVCRKLSGAKYEKALEWNVPIKMESWLLEQVPIRYEDSLSKGTTANYENETNINQYFMLDTKTIIDCGISPLIPKCETKSVHVSRKDVQDFSKHLVSIAQSVSKSTTINAKQPHSKNNGIEGKDASAESNSSFLPSIQHELSSISSCGTNLKQQSSNLKQSETTESSDDSAIFAGLNFALSPRLWHRRIELGNIVTSCGGIFKCTIDQECTHFIHYGNKMIENFKEFKQAKNQKCQIISPWWLIRSREAGRKLPEIDFPHIYVPGKILNLQSIPAVKPIQSIQLSCLAEVQHNDDSVFDEIDSLIEKNSKRLKCYAPSTDIEGEDKQNCVFGKTDASVSIGNSCNFIPPANDNTNTDQVNSSDYSTCGTVKFTDLEYEKAKSNLFKKCNINPAVTSHQTVDASDVNTLSNCEKVVIAPKTENPQCSSVFLLSALTEPQRASFAKYITKHGGNVLKTSSWDTTCTHLVCGTLARNEKVLSACAAGRWILKPSYVVACKDAGKFVSEQEYEWAHTDQSDLAVASRYWRNERELAQTKNIPFGPFVNWNCLLFVNPVRELPFKHVVEAGGGVVAELPSKLTSHLISSILSKLKYVFLENESFLAKVPKNLLVELEKQNIKMLKIDFISDFLIKKGIINDREYFIRLNH